MNFLLSLLAFTSISFSAIHYPDAWWAPVTGDDIPAWEILPQSAIKDKEVILSKRNELGIFSNLGATPFIFRGKKYASVEGVWQSMKYPEGLNDPRMNAPGTTWKYTREQVTQLSGFESKEAGDLANANMKIMGIDWVTFEGERIVYKGSGASRHYEILYAASVEKVNQNSEVKNLLKRTGSLILLPDHKVDPASPPAYRYGEIYMKIRENL